MPKMGLDWAELQACWEKVRDSGFFTEGNFTHAVEDEIAQRYGMHAVLVSSAGAGLFAMCKVMNVSGKRVVVQNNTFYATGAMPREAGAQVMLFDSRKDDFSLSIESLQAAPAWVFAVIMTHVGGGIAKDYGAISEWCSKRNIILMEDAAHALGACTWRMVPMSVSTRQEQIMAGHLSHGAVFSLYATKAVPVGEGGVIVTRDVGFARALREYRNYGKYIRNGIVNYRGRGFNLRMDEWSAAIAYLQIKRLDEILEMRQQAAHALSKVIPTMVDYGDFSRSNFYKYIVRADEAAELGITRFTGKVFARSDQLRTAMAMLPARELPNSEWIADNHVCLPLDEGLYATWDKDRILAFLRGQTA